MRGPRDAQRRSTFRDPARRDGAPGLSAGCARRIGLVVTGDLRGVFLGLLALPTAIYVVVAGWHVAFARTAPPDVRAAQAAIASRFLALATVLVGLAWLLAVMEPVHSPHVAAKSYADLLDVWWGLLPMVVIGSAIAGFLSSLLGTSNPLALAFWLGMPTAMYAGLAWAAYSPVRAVR